MSSLGAALNSSYLPGPHFEKKIRRLTIVYITTVSSEASEMNSLSLIPARWTADAGEVIGLRRSAAALGDKVTAKTGTKTWRATSSA